MNYKIIVYLTQGGLEVFYHASYREYLGNLVVEWCVRAGDEKRMRKFGPNEYFSYEVEPMY